MILCSFSLHLCYMSCPAPTAKSQKEIAHLPLLFVEKETLKFICFDLFLRWGLPDVLDGLRNPGFKWYSRCL